MRFSAFGQSQVQPRREPFIFAYPGIHWKMDSSKLTRAGALLQAPAATALALAAIATSVTASAAQLRGERIPPMQVKEEQVKVHVTMHKVRITMRHEREFDPRWGAARASRDFGYRGPSCIWHLTRLEGLPCARARARATPRRQVCDVCEKIYTPPNSLTHIHTPSHTHLTHTHTHIHTHTYIHNICRGKLPSSCLAV